MIKGSVNKNKFGFMRIVFFCMIFFLSLTAQSQDFEVVVDLEGEWKFSPGDDPAWSAINYNDADWDLVEVPGSWENSGYNDYNGYAWYRKEFRVPENIASLNPLLILGRVDDVDEVYINGKLVAASGVMPPVMITAFELQRRYWFPSDVLKPFEKNVIAVRVFDEYGPGGIVSGPVGFYSDKNARLLTVNLQGLWDFQTFLGKKSKRRMFFQDEGKIYVPAYWENFGYPDLDGKASYSRTFDLPPNFDEENMMVVLGYIDDEDEVYINGIRIGEKEQRMRLYETERHKDIIFRAYRIPPGTLKPGSGNFIKVIVTDTGGLGGIYEGPVGLITMQNFELLKYQQTKRGWNFWDDFLKDFFE